MPDAFSTATADLNIAAYRFKQCSKNTAYVARWAAWGNVGITHRRNRCGQHWNVRSHHRRGNLIHERRLKLKSRIGFSITMEVARTQNSEIRLPMSITPSFWDWFNGQLTQSQDSETASHFHTGRLLISHRGYPASQVPIQLRYIMSFYQMLH